jgi:hypothetical protein
MSVVAAAIIGSAVVGAGVSMSNAEDAEDAAYAQSQAAQAGMSEEQRRFDSIQELLKPYVSAGAPALTGQQDLLGLNGYGAQQAAVSGIQNGAEFQALLAQGENSILQNASATGGLRGGNTQAALAQFSPALLSAAINDRYAKLGGMTTLGQNSAVMQANAGQQSTNSIVQLLQQQGAAQAGGILAQGQGQANALGSIAQAFGTYAGYAGGGNGFGAGYGANAAPTTGYGVGNAGYGNYASYFGSGGI